MNKDKIYDISLIGVGCSGSYLLNKLSKKYNIVAFEAGIDRRKDNFTYNLGIAAPLDHSPLNKVAAFKNPTSFPGYPFSSPYPSPNGNTQWTGITNQLPYTVGTTPEYNPEIFPPVPAPQPFGWTQGIMIGGSNEHIQGVYVNPSTDRCNWWADILDDHRWSFKNLFPLLKETEKFRSQTMYTEETYDGTSYNPYDGPSAFGSFPINRGKDGLIQVVQNKPSNFSKKMAHVIYEKFHNNLNYHNFKIMPIVDDKKSLTFNSGVNICVTTAVETFLDIHRTRSSYARAYLNETVMTNIFPDESSPYGGSTNDKIYKGINCHNFILNLNTLIQRIVFKTKKGYPNGNDYWTHNYSINEIKSEHFIHPLKAIGVEYINGEERIFVKSKRVICTLGTLGSPVLLMQSGIGPSNLLSSLKIPVLLDQPNLGKYVTNHMGSAIKWTGDLNIWGNQELGTDNSNGYLPGPLDPKNRRKFQYYSGYTPRNRNFGIPDIWNINFYDLTPKSDGFIETKQSIDIDGGLLNVRIIPNYYSNNDDIVSLTWIVKRVAESIIEKDPTAVFLQPGPNSNPIPYTNGFPFLPDEELFPLLMQVVSPPGTGGFVQQAHYVGGCGMGNNENIHCVDKNFLLRGTKNVNVCDASSAPTEIEGCGVIYPVQSDGNTSKFVNSLSIIFANQLLDEHCDCKKLIK